MADTWEAAGEPEKLAEGGEAGWVHDERGDLTNLSEEEKLSATPIERISPSEAQQRQQSGGYMADGSVAPREALVDPSLGPDDAPVGSPAASGTDRWEQAGEPEALTPQPMRQMPDDFQEAQYQQWVKDNSTPNPGGHTSEFRTPGMKDRSVTVDPYGNGIDADLRAMYHNHAPEAAVPYKRDLNVTPEMLEKYQTPDSTTLTADSVYAKGQPKAKLGTWGTDDEGLPEFHDSNWQPASATSKVMSKAGKLASAAYDSVASGEALDPMKALQNAKETVVDPLLTGAQNTRQNLSVIANQSHNMNVETLADQISKAEKAKPALPEFRRAAAKQIQQAHGALGVLDAYLENPRATLATVIQGLSEGATALGLAAGAGAAGGAVGGAVVTGPAAPVGAAVGGILGTAAGAGAGGYLDAYGGTIIQTIRDSGVDMTDKAAVKAALQDPVLMARAMAAGKKAGIPAAIINAVSFGVAGKLYQPVKALAGGGKVGVAAGIGAETTTQAGIGAGGEASREAVQDPNLDPAKITAAGLAQVAPTLAFTGLHARGEAKKAAAAAQPSAAPGAAPGTPPPGAPPSSGFNPEDLLKPKAGPFDRQSSYDNYENARKAATAGDTAGFDAAHQRAQEDWVSAQAHADANPDDAHAQNGAAEAKQTLEAGFWQRYRTEAEKNAKGPEQPKAAGATVDEATPAAAESFGTSPSPTRATKEGDISATAEPPSKHTDAVSYAATHADDAGEIKTEATDTGAAVTVKGEPVAHFDDPKEADAVVEQAQTRVDERRVNLSRRKNVDEMTPEEMRAELLVHPLTRIPNMRAYDESQKLPTQVSVDADSLKWYNSQGSHQGGDQLIRTIARALDEQSPGNAYHKGGDEFVLQAASPEEAEAHMAAVKDRLANTKIEMLAPDGRKLTVNGIGVTHGIGQDFETADRAMAEEKSRRTAAGLRAERDQQPPGASFAPVEEGLPDHQSHAAATETDAAPAEEVKPPTRFEVGQQWHDKGRTQQYRVLETHADGARAKIDFDDGHSPVWAHFDTEWENGWRTHDAPAAEEVKPAEVLGQHIEPPAEPTPSQAEAGNYKKPEGDLSRRVAAKPNITPKVEAEAPGAQTVTHGDDRVPAERVSEAGAGTAPGDAAAGDHDRQPLDERVAESGEGAPGDGGIPGVPQGAGGEGAPRAGGPDDASLGAPRDSGTVRPESGAAADGPVGHDLEDENIGAGGLRTKYKDNIAAIKILRALETEKRISTPAERTALARYVGWGALKGVFDPKSIPFAKEHVELKGLLTEAEFKAARASTLNAHYTAKPVVKGIFNVLQQLGFNRGRILESSVGTGNFFGLMPRDMRTGSELHGVELDPLTAKIAAALYPNAQIHNVGFQNFDIPSEYFDAAIGNPPFGDEPIVDAARSPYSGNSIHNYFLSKMIDKLRPGGLMAVVVSHNFLDASTPQTRQWIADRADLVGAARLPNTTFKGSAGTEVVTDIVVFQKRAEGTEGNGATWVGTAKQLNKDPKTDETHLHNVNQYMVDNPAHVLGNPSAAGTMYRPGEYTVTPYGGLDLGKQLERWAETVAEKAGLIFTPIERGAQDKDIPAVAIPDGVKVGSYFVDKDGAIHTRTDDALGKKTSEPWAPPNKIATERMTRMIGIRERMRDQMRLERSPEAGTKEIEANRKKLNAAYDQMVKKFGLLNNQANRRLFADDTEADLITGLEFDYDAGVSKAVADRTGAEERKPSATKAPMLERRVLFPPADDIKVSNAQDALLSSLNFKGRVDPDYMASVYDKTPAQIEEELGDLVFRDPLGGLITADEYLSGDVKTKLAQVEQDPALARNAAALRKVIPTDKLPSQIHATLGAAFIPPKVYEDFAKHITGAETGMMHLPTGQWVRSPKGKADVTLNETTYGTKDRDAGDILDRTMAGQGVVVTRTVREGGETRTYVDEEATELARSKQEDIKAEWKKWLWSDPTRADLVAGQYNEKMNRLVDRKYDGSHMKFPGMSPAITLLDHQKNAVWRGLQSRQMLLDHVVGAGKTFVMATLAMEMRRLGISRKPIFAVPNHLTGQWRSEFLRLYPAARILVASPDDFAKANRGKFFAKVVAGDWDSVVLGHSSLKKIGLPRETEERVVGEEVAKLTQAIKEAKDAGGDRFTIRQMENLKAKLEARFAQKLNDIGKRDKMVSFDELGLDSMHVDELHEFKNLFYSSQMARTAGMGNPEGSDKGFDLFIKLRWLTDTFGTKAPIVGATGTPVSNSLVEMYNMQRYMQYPTLAGMGLDVFDDWARQFGQIEPVYEVAPSGTGWRSSTRFQKFANLPALMGLYKSFADIIPLSHLVAQEEAQGKVFPIPKLSSGGPINVVAERSKQVADFMGTPRLTMAADGLPDFDLPLREGAGFRGGTTTGVRSAQDPTTKKWKNTGTLSQPEGEPIEVSMDGEYETAEDAAMGAVQEALSPSLSVDPASILGQFENLRNLMRETNGKINALSLTNQANKAGLDFRLIDPSAPDHPGSKINMAVERIVKHYREWAKDKGTQLVFCDLSVPHSSRTTTSSVPHIMYVRDNNGLLNDKRGTLHTVEGHESIPYLLHERGTKATRQVDLYDAASGGMVRGNFQVKGEAHVWARQALNDENTRTNWHLLRNRTGEISQEAIDAHNDANDIDPAEVTKIITREDIAGSSASAKFSVYDDMKAKLIKAGIPAREIAFIHDHPSPAAKAKLFAAVNAGDVRVLFGSTPKLGAGTNVQKRLVALHHIDAPWRPSDLEQREGRIIRRGNDLYYRDPQGFEVHIYRYATAQTYDTRRWQILEHKAGGIEQLRNYDPSMESVEDIEGEASNSAEMKAASSGDPLILEETKRKNEVTALERLSAASADAQVSLRQRARYLKHQAEDTLPPYIVRDTAQLKVATANPPDKDGWAPVSVEGNAMKDAEAFATIINKEVKDLNEMAVMGVTHLVYRGLKFSLETRKGFGGKVIDLAGPSAHISSYMADKEKGAIPVSPTGLIVRLQNYVDRLQPQIDANKAEIPRLLAESVTALENSKKGFEKQAELDEARKQYRAVKDALMKKGPPVPTEDLPALAYGTLWQKKLLRSLGLGGALDELHASLGMGREEEPIPPGEPPKFARGLVAVGGKLTHAQVHGRIAALMSKFKWQIPIKVYPTAEAMFADPRLGPMLRALGETPGSFLGFVHDGTYYAPADQFPNLAAVNENFAHEYVGHTGVAAFYGNEENPAYARDMDGIARDNRNEVIAIGKRENPDFDIEDPEQRRAAAEEAFVYQAQKDAAGQSVPARMRRWLNRVWARIRDWARRLFGAKQLYDKTWMRGMAAAMEAHLRANEREAAAQSRPKFARPVGTPPTGPRGPKAYELARTAVASAWTNPLSMWVREYVNPKDISAMSKLVARTTMPYLGSLAQHQHQVIDRLQEFARAMDRLSPTDLLDIDDDMEHGRPQRNPEYQPMADTLRKLLDDWAAHVQNLGLGNLENLIENYLPHIWRDPAKAKEAFMSGMSRRPMRGPMTFLKKRTIPTLREGIALGLKPLTLNPLILTFLKVAEMQKYVMGVTMMRQYKTDGLAKFIPGGRTPDGWADIDDAIAKVRQWSDADGGFIDRGRYVMPTDGARIINNHLSASKLEAAPPIQILKTLSNSAITLQLGFSLYHAGFTSNDVLISKLALGIERLAHGEPLRAAAAFGEYLTGPVAIGMNIRRGILLKRAYYHPQNAPSEMQRQVAMLTGANGSVTMDRYYQAAQGISPFRGYGVRDLAGDIKLALTQPQGKVAAATKALGNYPIETAQATWRGLGNMGREYHFLRWPFELTGRMVRASTGFIMETLVPLQKLGVASDMFADWLRRNPAGDPVDRNEAAQSAWRSVDNRLGEIVYDDKFWNRTFKMALHLGLRAVGWKFGDVEEIGGAAADTFKVFDRAMRERKYSPDMVTHKMAYTLAMYIHKAILGAIACALAGVAVKSFQDLMFPPTGKKKPDGTPERASFPDYGKDVYEATHHPWQFAKNSANPIWSAGYQAISGKDWKDQPYLNPNESAMQSGMDRIGHFFGQGEPFSFTQRNQFVGAGEKDNPNAWMWKVAPQLGFTPAPGYITKPELLELGAHEHDEKDYEQKLKRDIRDAMRAGDKPAADKARKELQDLAKHYGKDKMEEGKLRRENPKPPKTSSLMDTVGPLIDGSASRAEMANKIHAAGFPALAGLIGALPDRMRPQVHARLEEYA
jgi:N12 class adenine-specific DNA methylase/GGDEF domain-containing protein